MKRLSILVLITACGGHTSYTQKAQKSLTVTYETVQIAEKAFVSWDGAHQQAIVAKATTPEEATSGLDKYRDKRQPVIKAFIVVYSSIAAASAVIPLVDKGLKPEADLMLLLGDAFKAALDVKTAIDAIRGE